jgi:DeoR/GlpR family transcriptional regulator of sugar metabolism
MQKMTKEERIAQIQSFISEHRMASIAELLDLTEVSRMTLHRDLEVLVQRGTIEKLHGSIRLKEHAYSPATSQFVGDGAYNITRAMSMNIAAKQEIAGKAATFIDKHDTLFISTGTTTLELVRVIAASDLAVTIVTGSIPVADLCQATQLTQLIMTGGDYHRRTNSLIGALARSSLESLTGRILFMSANYVDLQGGFTTTFNQIAELLRLMRSQCKLTIALMDSSKFGKVNAHRVYNVDEVDAIITDSSIDPEIYGSWREAGVNLIRADE